MKRDYSIPELAEILGKLNDGALPQQGLDLFESGALDSLRLIQFVMLLEEVYGFQFDYSDIQLESFKNLEAVQRLLRARYS